MPPAAKQGIYTLETRPQARMGLPRLFELTLTGIRYRLFRSFMTVVVIAVAAGRGK